jgi:uncharacterized phage infection (PIP) family protein YhgE
MYKAAAGVKAADQELGTLADELPRVRTALQSSQKILEHSRETLATVLKNRYLIEPLLKSLPETAARLADDLPKLTLQLSTVLRNTERLKETAAGLRRAQQQLDQSSTSWPHVRKTLQDTAAALTDYRHQLHTVAAQEKQRWSSVSDTSHEGSSVGTTLEQVAEVQAAQGRSSGQWLHLSRWALFLLAGFALLLGVSQLLSKSR